MRQNILDLAATPGVGDGQDGLACCDSWGLKESDTTERLNSTELSSLAPSPFERWGSQSPKRQSDRDLTQSRAWPFPLLLH